MNDFYPDSVTISRMRQSHAADSSYDWKAAIASQELPNPRSEDMTAVIAQFLGIADQLELSTCDVPFWVVVVPFAPGDVGRVKQFAVIPPRPELLYAGPYPNAGEPLNELDSAANPNLAADVRDDLMIALVHVDTKDEFRVRRGVS